VIQIFGTAKCKRTRAAERFFKERAIRVQVVDLRQKGLSKGELESVANAVGGAGALLDKTGARAKNQGLHAMTLSEERILDILLSDPLLLVTPIVRDGPEATVGDDSATWKRFAARARQAERP
jgi:arsenate reductase